MTEIATLKTAGQRLAGFGKPSNRVILWIVLVAGLAIFVSRSFPSFDALDIVILLRRHYPAILISTLALLIGHALRAEKMVLLLDKLHPDSRFAVYRCLAIGYLFNFVLPLRVGELIRAHLLGRSLAITRTATILAIIFERIVDALILGAAAATIGLLFHIGQLASAAGIMLAIGTALALGLAYIVRPGTFVLEGVLRSSALLNNALRDRARYSAWSSIRYLQLLRRVARWDIYIALSLLMWLMYFLAIGMLLANLMPDLQVRDISTLSVKSYVAASLPAGPVNLSEFLAAFHYLGNISGNGRDPLSVAAVIWMVLTLPTSLLGVIFLFFHSKAPRFRPGLIPAEIQKLMRHGKPAEDFSAFLENYFQRSSLFHTLDRIEAAGHAQNLRILSGGSLALTVLVDVQGALRVRKISLPQHAAKLDAQRQWLQRHEQYGHFPKIVADMQAHGSTVIDMPYYANYEPLFAYIHRNSVANSVGRLSSILAVLRGTVYSDTRKVRRQDVVRQYIDIKVAKKIANAALVNDAIGHLCGCDVLIINGTQYLGLSRVLDRIFADEAIVEDLASFEESDIHGDLTVDNILVSQDGENFLILDPNNENDISDMIVDVAKLWQSIHSGYEFLREVKEITVTKNTITFSEARSEQYQQIYAALSAQMAAELPRHRFRALLFHEAVHYCRMLTYRTAINSTTAPLFLAVAVRLFNDFIDQYDIN